ncbi:hypothetical protein [Streptomyces sp. NPDC058614]|uniref:hypothetical protein n=1 Tax=Streptomyces sp. NPDC058614 TaxID=3346557 RepID=UPI003651DEAF
MSAQTNASPTGDTLGRPARGQGGSVSEHRPGEWPVTEPADLDALLCTVDPAQDPDEMYVKRAAEKALHEMVLNSIRHDLGQQPTGPSAQAKARVWCAHILAISDEVAEVKRRAA